MMIRRLFSLAATPFLQFYQLPLAALISLDGLRNALSTLGYPAVGLFIMIESAGIPFPGETMLLLASFYAAVDQQLQIPWIIVCAALGAIIGDNIGFLVGRTGGHAFVRRFGRYIFLKPEHLELAERFFARHGDKTVFFGRFIAILRAWAAFLAGVNRMRWSSFLIYNAAGGIVWAIAFGCLGFLAGRVFHENFAAVEHLARTISWVGVGVVVALIVVLYVIFRVRRTRRKLAELRSEEMGEKEASELTEEAFGEGASSEERASSGERTASERHQAPLRTPESN